MEDALHRYPVLIQGFLEKSRQLSNGRGKIRMRSDHQERYAPDRFAVWSINFKLRRYRKNLIFGSGWSFKKCGDRKRLLIPNNCSIFAVYFAQYRNLERF